MEDFIALQEPTPREIRRVVGHVVKQSSVSSDTGSRKLKRTLERLQAEVNYSGMRTKNSVGQLFVKDSACSVIKPRKTIYLTVGILVQLRCLARKRSPKLARRKLNRRCRRKRSFYREELKRLCGRKEERNKINRY